MAQTPPSNNRVMPFLAWVWAGMLILGGAGYFALTSGLIAYGGPLLPIVAGASALLALPFAVRWLVHREEWWAALVTWTFLSIASLLLLVFLRLPADQIVGMVALLEVALPFAALFAADRSRWIMLLPAYVLVVLAGLLGLTAFGVPLATLGAFALLATALPFWFAYMVNKMLWWALVPAGLFSLLGVGLLGYMALTASGQAVGFYVLVNAALAVVSLAVWLTVRRLDWAIWLAVGFALAAALSIWFPSGANWALVALTLGLYIAFKQIDASYKRKMAARGQAAPAQSQQPAPPAASSPAPPAPTAQPAAPASPPTAPPAAPMSPPDIDRAASEGQPVPSRKPVVEFRPLDPFQSQPDDEDES